MSTTRQGFYVRAILCAEHGESWSPPASIEWMPAGRRVIRCGGPNGEPVECETVTTEEDAVRLNAQLQALLDLANKGEASRPFIDFDHEGGAAAAIPKRFFWDGGIRLEVEWTASGLAALKGRDYSYFSPTWIIDESGRPEALPDKGPIGALVNTPAFQDIERLAAKNAAPAAQQKENNKMETIIAKLVAAGLMDKESAPANEDQLVECLLAKMKAANDMTDLAKKETEVATAKLVSITEEIAKSEVSAAVASGKIDKESSGVWEADFKSDILNARKRLASIKTANSANLSGFSKKEGEEKKPELTGLARAIAARKAQLAKN